MKILITGGKGMLGRTLRGEFREHEVVVAGLPEADITDAAGIDAVCRSCKPDVLIHCAAMTDVDKCETCPDMAWPQLASVTVLDSSPYPLTTFFQETLKDRIPSLIRRPAVSTFMDKVNGQGSRLFVRTVRIILLSVFHGSMVPVVQALCTLC